MRGADAEGGSDLEGGGTSAGGVSAEVSAAGGHSEGRRRGVHEV